VLLRTACVICGRASGVLCAECVGRLEPAERPLTPPGLDAVSSVLRFDGAGRDLLLALKYRNRRAAVGVLAVAMAAGVDAGTVDLVTWAPTSPRRRRERGFDQARLLARAVARALHRPVRGTLRRAPTPPQTGLDARRRRLGPAFRAVRPVPGRVLLVDDVITTGATLEAAARAVRAGGATGVRGVTAAVTPLKLAR
jgi:predicted amidophosphoribosyltransferase